MIRTFFVLDRIGSREAQVRVGRSCLFRVLGLGLCEFMNLRIHEFMNELRVSENSI